MKPEDIEKGGEMNKEGLYLDQKKQVVWTMPIETVKEDELTWNMLQK